MNLFFIPNDENFLENFAKGLTARFNKDPVYFSKIEIILSSRRAVRSLVSILSKNKSIILPKIHSLGEFAEEIEELLFDSNLNVRIISKLEQKLILSQIIQEISGNLSYIESLNLANDIARLINILNTYQVNYSDLSKIYPEDIPKHFADILHLIEASYEKYRVYLAENKIIDFVSYRNLLLVNKAKLINEGEGDFPIIIAGVRSNIPAVIELHKAVANNKNGYVVSEGNWYNSAEFNSELPKSHPLYLSYFYYNLSDKKEALAWDSSAENLLPKYKLLEYMFLPAEESYRLNENIEISKQLSNIQIIEGENLFCEARLASFKILEFLHHHPEEEILVITNNNVLADYLANNLLINNIVVNRSEAINLTDMAIARFFMQIADMVIDLDKVKFLDLLKNNLCKNLTRNLAELEIKKFRRKYLQVNPIDYLEEKLSTKFNKLNIILNKHASFAEIFDLHEEIFNEIIEDKDSREYEFFISVLQEIKKLHPLVSNLKENYSTLILQMIGEFNYRPYNLNNKIKVSILTPLEARLHKAKLVMLIGMNEECWPQSFAENIWLNNSIRSAINLPLKEENLGIEAYDFYNYFFAENLYISYAKKINGSLAPVSRFISRLELILRKIKMLDQVKNPNPYMDWYKAMYFNIEKKEQEISFANPPLDARPKKLYVTSIDKLINNPYNFYAKEILKLKKLDDINYKISSKDFGSVVHRLLELLINNQDSDIDKILDKIFTEFNIKNHIILNMWLPRIWNIIKWFKDEIKKNTHKTIHTEIEGVMDLDGFEIKARADRIDEENDKITIIDYKTGSPPEQGKIKKGQAPQMPLEMLIAKHGGFSLEPDFKTIEAKFIKIIGGAEEVAQEINIKDINLEEFEKYIKEVLSHYLVDKNIFEVKDGLEYDDYEHLARVIAN